MGYNTKSAAIAKESIMNITSSTQDTTTTLALDGWLDTSTAPQLADELAKIDSGCTSLVLDFSNLEYISSAGLRQVVAAHKKMRGALPVPTYPPRSCRYSRWLGSTSA